MAISLVPIDGVHHSVPSGEIVREMKDDVPVETHSIGSDEFGHALMILLRRGVR
jgi:hypothetical protein